MDYTFFFVGAFLAEVIGTIAGFGSSTVLLPMALLFFDFKTALVLVAFMHLFGNLGRVTFFRKGVTWRVLGYFGVASVVGSLIGAQLVSIIDQNIPKALLGVFLVIYAIFAWKRRTFHISQTKPSMVGGGVSSGVLAGLIGTGGALRSAFLTAYDLPKAQYIGTAAAIALLVDTTRIPLYIYNNLLAGSFFWMLPLLFILALAGSYTGKHLVDRIPQHVFQKIVLACLALVGAKLLFDFVIR